MTSEILEGYGEVCPAWVTSTRRFCARPLAVLFAAMGFASPKPRAEIMSGFTPCEIRYCITASARFCDSTSFEVTPSRFSAGLDWGVVGIAVHHELVC